MKILLAYSKAHFDPSKKKSEHKYWDSSANIISRNLYESLSKLGDVTYIDCWHREEIESVTNQEFDVFIGIIDKFADIVSKITAKKKILWAVNSHPTYRNNQLKTFMEREHLGQASLNDWDIVDDSFLESVNLADYIIGVGDNVTYNTYISEGVDKKKIKMVNYGVGETAKISNAKSNRFLYLSSDIGLRKGFDIITAIFSHPAVLEKNFHLDIVGPISTKHYEKKMRVFEELTKGKVTYHGWVPADSKKYDDIVSNASFLVFPSLEEGQAGTVLDGLARGIIPISSQHSGVPFSPLGNFDLSTVSDTNVALILEALNLTKPELSSLRQHAKRYYEEFHGQWTKNLEETLDNVIHKDRLYPKISVVLPIFNKQEIIEDLIANLDESCKVYGNNELHVIFDGCKDDTEKLVRKFYKDKNDYPVTFEVTPNIFEVKTNNIGLKKSTGKYAAIIQDDNFIYDRNLFFETAMLLDNNPKIAILGGLAGVNFYPLGYKNIKGPGQIAINDNESYWRQDAATNPEYKNRYYEVDACMRGPLIFRKSFLEEHGYLDEAFAPFYMDDMDISMRAKKFGYHVYTALFNVENRSSTIAHYNTKERQKFWEDTMSKNGKLFYQRWTPSIKKDYDWINRVKIVDSTADIEREKMFKYLNTKRAEDKARYYRRKAMLLAPAVKTKRRARAIAGRIKNKISS